MKIQGEGITDTGLVRARNEDAFLVENDLRLFAVADGMGGAAAGEVASQIFVRSAEEVFLTGIRQGKPLERLVENAFHTAHNRMSEHVLEFPDHQGMGCTGEILAFNENSFFLGHVGDSRTYLWRKGELRLLTVDHSLAQKHIDEGLISAEEGEHYQYRNVLYRAVGQEEELQVDIISEDIARGDTFLLCSDGLVKEVSEKELSEYLSNMKNLYETGEKLVQFAKGRGGRDNITVVLCKVVTPENSLKGGMWKKFWHKKNQ